MAHEAKLVVDAKADLGEGPIWDQHKQRLIWVNIIDKELHFFDPATNQDRVVQVEQMPGTVVLRKSGGLMLALNDGFASFDSDTETLEFWTDPESDKPGNRFNDGKCDPAGRFWAGTMPLAENEPSGSLYCLHTDRKVRHMFDGVRVSNGLAWSGDAKTMYYIDTLTYGIDAFDYDVKSGDINNRRTIAKVSEEQGAPDGMTIDAEGRLWVAHWGGHRVNCWDPNRGQIIDWVDVPAAQVTACWFGGPELDKLYITTARHGLDDAALAKQPLAGGLFCAEPGPHGLPAAEYGG